MLSKLYVIFVFQVWAAVPPWKQGSLAEFVTLTEYEVSYGAGRSLTTAVCFHHQLSDHLLEGLSVSPRLSERDSSQESKKKYIF